MHNEDYQPVSCQLHSELELAIMRGLHLRVSWKDNQLGEQIEQLKPIDMITRDKKEFLIAQNGQQIIEIRLDAILHFKPV